METRINRKAQTVQLQDLLPGTVFRLTVAHVSSDPKETFMLLDNTQLPQYAAHIPAGRLYVVCLRTGVLHTSEATEKVLEVPGVFEADL